MGKPACSPAILWPSGYRAAFLCVRMCVYPLAAQPVDVISPAPACTLPNVFFSTVMHV